MGADKFQSNLLGLQKNLLSFAMTLTSNRDNAYDLVQDTTLKALDNRDKYTEGTNFKGWVFTIMRNIFINNYRRQSRASVMIDTSENLYHLNMAQEENMELPSDSYTAKEINDAISQFDADLREPFTMHVTGYKYNEIAEHLHLPLGTVKSRIFMARRKLQEQFADYAC